jgi:SPP1 family predicted phage head-tail adaptor
MAMTVRANALRKAVTIMQPAWKADDYGDPSQQTFTTLATVYAEIEPLTGQQLTEARQVHSEVSHRVRIRYLKGLTAACQVEWQSRKLQIVAVMNAEERDTMWTLLCRELPNG